MVKKNRKVELMIGADHAGFDLKKCLLETLSAKGIPWEDVGTYNGESVDYPDYALRVARAVVSKECDRGILVCGTGLGMSLAANKVRGVRAVVVHDVFSAEMSRRHNDSNVLCLGADVISPGAMASKIVQVWLDTPFEGERHARRVKKIMDLEGS